MAVVAFYLELPDKSTDLNGQSNRHMASPPFGVCSKTANTEQHPLCGLLGCWGYFIGFASTFQALHLFQQRTGELEQQLLCSHAVEGDLQQLIAAHGRHARHHARTEALVLHPVAGL